MRSAFWTKDTRVKLEAGYLEDPKLRVGVVSQKRLQHFVGNTPGAPDSHMRMKRLEFGFQARPKNRILNSPMENKKMRMSFSHPCPNHRDASSRSKDSHSSKRKQERRHSHGLQSVSQAFL